MATESKRFTFSLTTELEQELDRAKQETYYNGHRVKWCGIYSSVALRYWSRSIEKIQKEAI